MPQVSDEEFRAVDGWLGKQVLLQTSAVRRTTYTRLRAFCRRLYECNRDQMVAIKGLQEHNALMKTQVKQEELSL